MEAGGSTEADCTIESLLPVDLSCGNNGTDHFASGTVEGLASIAAGLPQEDMPTTDYAHSEHSWEVVSQPNTRPNSIAGDHAEQEEEDTLLATLSDTDVVSTIKTVDSYISDRTSENATDEAFLHGELAFHPILAHPVSTSSPDSHDDDSTMMRDLFSGDLPSFEDLKALPIVGGGLLALDAARETGLDLFSRLAARLHDLYKYVAGKSHTVKERFADTVQEMARALQVNIVHSGKTTATAFDISLQALPEAISRLQTAISSSISALKERAAPLDWTRLVLMTAVGTLGVLYLKEYRSNMMLAASLVEKEVEVADLLNRVVQLQRYVAGPRHVPVIRYTSCSAASWPTLIPVA